MTYQEELENAARQYIDGIKPGTHAQRTNGATGFIAGATWENARIILEFEELKSGRLSERLKRLIELGSWAESYGIEALKHYNLDSIRLGSTITPTWADKALAELPKEKCDYCSESLPCLNRCEIDLDPSKDSWRKDG